MTATNEVMQLDLENFDRNEELQEGNHQTNKEGPKDQDKDKQDRGIENYQLTRDQANRTAWLLFRY